MCAFSVSDYSGRYHERTIPVNGLQIVGDLRKELSETEAETDCPGSDRMLSTAL